MGKKDKRSKSPKGKKDKDKKDDKEGSPSELPEEEKHAEDQTLVASSETKSLPPLPPGELPGPPPVVKPEFTYNKELTLEQLQQILALSVNLEDTARCLAGIMQLGDIVFDARNLILLEYCLGIIMFGKNAGLKITQIQVIYDLGHMILDIIRAGNPFAEAERIFRNRLISMSMKNADKSQNPMFSAWDLERITPYFTSTVFQHYCLYQYCFTKDHYNITRDERVWIETPFIYPLSESQTTEEVEAEKAAKKAAAEKAEAEAKEAALKASQDAFALLDAEARLRAEEELKRRPLNLQQAIDIAVRDKVLVAKQSLIEEYHYREKYLLEKVLRMQGDEGNTKEHPETKKPKKEEKGETGNKGEKGEKEGKNDNATEEEDPESAKSPKSEKRKKKEKKEKKK
ncbi:hypothetical protein R1sor_011154 [Riccia sorocarpa]|uniref:Uncharacterized protein n=1 Tax=Riccia sorocarpa TaxID=122646 RepID=A0ABD3I028_9MARC